MFTVKELKETEMMEKIVCLLREHIKTVPGYQKELF